MSTRIALTALVGRTGAVLLRMRDEQSAVRANRWSLPGGAIRPGETPVNAAKRHIAEQTGLPVDGEPDLFWHGFLPGTRVDVYCFAVGTPRGAPTSCRSRGCWPSSCPARTCCPGGRSRPRPGSCWAGSSTRTST
ncbi:NUDIX hydrolase [Catellatospora bangladeshensis]|uniref:NUDIX hydrolase n=1 Tax=Catellatospora bangladeshensis TaxID=310355 RepID=UPI003610597E